MNILVIGGSGSGKSEYAENLLCVRTPGGAEKTYLATMETASDAARLRIARHLEKRAGKGFRTVERQWGLSGALPDCSRFVLLECVSNLLSNEFFGQYFGRESRGAEAVFPELAELMGRSCEAVLVTNDIFCDGRVYDAETEQYRRELGELNRMLAEKADAVVEVCAGLPVVWKGVLG